MNFFFIKSTIASVCSRFPVWELFLIQRNDTNTNPNPFTQKIIWCFQNFFTGCILKNFFLSKYLLYQTIHMINDLVVLKTVSMYLTWFRIPPYYPSCNVSSLLAIIYG